MKNIQTGTIVKVELAGKTKIFRVEKVEHVDGDFGFFTGTRLNKDLSEDRRVKYQQSFSITKSDKFEIIEEQTTMNLLEDVKFATSSGKEVTAQVIGDELHVSCKDVFYFILSKEDQEAKEIVNHVNPPSELTEKESKVLQSACDNTLEIGLPVSVDEIKQDTKFSKKTIVGIVGSLTKKGLIEDYYLSTQQEFMVSEKGFELIEKELV